MKGIFKIVGHSADTKTISVKFSRLHSQTSIDDYTSASVDYSNYDLTSKEFDEKKW